MRMLLLSLALIALTAAQGLAGPKTTVASSESGGQRSDLVQPGTIAGQGEFRAAVNQAVMTFHVTTSARSFREAAYRNQRVCNKITSFLKKYGLGPDRVHTARVISVPQSGRPTEKEKTQSVVHRLRIMTRDERELRAVMRLPDQFPEATYRGTELQYAKSREVNGEIPAEPRMRVQSGQPFGSVKAPVGLIVAGNSTGLTKATPLPPPLQAGTRMQTGSDFADLVYQMQVSAFSSVESAN